ncbi:chalcone isomerase family protein [Bdellovibrio bacteriovorus]|uniref:chalcone isomerase family protein n=1 Tax=Bdellovibrio bacteriovorus TaxID=959 RepID=UPI0035A6ADB0
MRIIACALLSSLLMLSLSSNAALLQLEKGTRTIEGVNVAKSAQGALDNKKIELGSVGAGLRWKKVLLMKVKVYVAQLLISSPERFVRKSTEALKSLEDSESVAIQLSFLRSVDADTVQSSFRDALSANKVDMQNPSVKTFLDAVRMGGDADAGASLTILVTKHSDGSESLIYEDTAGHQTRINGDKGLAHKIFSIWLGTPADDGVASLKNDILNP